MRNKSAVTFAMMLLFVINAFCQPPPKKTGFTGGVTSLIAWVANLDVVIANIHETQKLKRLSRLLGDASLDIDEIASQKELLVLKLAKLTPQNKTTMLPELESLTSSILDDIQELIKNLQALKLNVSNVDQPVVEAFIQTIDKEFRNKKEGYFVEIKTMLDNNIGSIDKLRNDAKESKEIADTASEQIKLARGRVFEKLKSL